MAHSQSDNFESKGVNPLTAAIMGAAVGAVAVLLSDQKNRKVFQKKLDEIKHQGQEQLEKMRQNVKVAEHKSRRVLADKLDDAKRKVDNEPTPII